MFFELVVGVPVVIVFQPLFLDWLFSFVSSEGIVVVQSLFFMIAIVVGLLLSSMSWIRMGVDLLAMRYVRNQLTAYQESRHYLTLVFVTFVMSFVSVVVGVLFPSLLLWLFLSPYYLGYFVILVSILLYSIGSLPLSEPSSLGSGWLLLSLPLVFVIVLLSQLWGTTPFVWTLVLFYHVLRLPLRSSFGYAVASVIAYYTFYILYVILFAGYDTVDFGVVDIFVLIGSVFFLVGFFRFMMLPFRVSVLSLLCFCLGVGYLLWV